eukprot:GILJ01005934.1.p1 GENE.GILJ01005934.1~~GILJ01005934.1.p1  ORF type:complete len:1582 (-),score=305.89 GILJ01005934.1:99-4844(-)
MAPNQDGIRQHKQSPTEDISFEKNAFLFNGNGTSGSNSIKQEDARKNSRKKVSSRTASSDSQNTIPLDGIKKLFNLDDLYATSQKLDAAADQEEMDSDLSGEDAPFVSYADKLAALSESNQPPSSSMSGDSDEMSSGSEGVSDELLPHMRRVQLACGLLNPAEAKRLASESKHHLRNGLPPEVYQNKPPASFIPPTAYSVFDSHPYNPSFATDDVDSSIRKRKQADDASSNKDTMSGPPPAAKSSSKKSKGKDDENADKEKVRKAYTALIKRDIFKAQKAMARQKADAEVNLRKVSQLCAREVRKKAGRTARAGKENVNRARRLARDMLVYWKRREKEMAETRKRREKEEIERRKREDEEQEALLQKRRLEYIMRQSDLYSHFMAKKLGIATDDQAPAGGIDPAVQIDDDAAEEAAQLLISETKMATAAFDEETQKYRAAHGDKSAVWGALGGAGDFTGDQDAMTTIAQPTSLKGQLKEYQLKGLRWLDNLYEQGINGILADEMGLGKTIQAISLLALLSQHKNNWGPFLIVSPTSTLHNWQQELNRFCPHLKTLPYWGGLNERKTLRKSLSSKALYTAEAPFHVLITSYQIVVTDEKYFHRVKWQYMILDEAQAIKSSVSQRWKTLLSFNCRNRLLLTGTPIQNSMAELWALLHFIMPKLFDSHEQFNEWFSKDIEAHSQDQKALNEHQLGRLHAILKPFMLRRVKKDVENEMPEKFEHEVPCEMTPRQRILYYRIKSKMSISELLSSLSDTNAKVESLMNLVMQFRKVCNHPEIFERRPVKSSYHFQAAFSLTPPPPFGQIQEVRVVNRNPILLQLPRLFWRELHGSSNSSGCDFDFYQSRQFEILRHINIFKTDHMYRSMFPVGWSSPEHSRYCNSTFSFIRFAGYSVGELEYLVSSDSLFGWLAHLHFTSRFERLNHVYGSYGESGNETFEAYSARTERRIDKSISVASPLQTSLSLLLKPVWRPESIASSEWKGGLPGKDNLFVENYEEYFDGSRPLVKAARILFRAVSTAPIDVYVSCAAFVQQYSTVLQCAFVTKLLTGSQRVTLCKPSTISIRIRRYVAGSIPELYQVHPLEFGPVRPTGRNGWEISSRHHHHHHHHHHHTSHHTSHHGSHHHHRHHTEDCRKEIELAVLNRFPLLEPLNDRPSVSTIEIPTFGKLVADCGKLRVLDHLLYKLKSEGHRVLIFCQMTKMLDILEDYMHGRKFRFFRLDGSTSIADRRDMVDEFQSNAKIFAFLLSTRAGGLGLNLIAADTVIFYDNDWNPTMDAQAMDRVHRIGQTKVVNIYRLITKGTVEERIVKRAKQKQTMQSTVYAGGALKADFFKPQEVLELLYDESELGGEETKKLLEKNFTGGSKGKRKAPIAAAANAANAAAAGGAVTTASAPSGGVGVGVSTPATSKTKGAQPTAEGTAPASGRKRKAPAVGEDGQPLPKKPRAPRTKKTAEAIPADDSLIIAEDGEGVAPPPAAGAAAKGGQKRQRKPKAEGPEGEPKPKKPRAPRKKKEPAGSVVAAVGTPMKDAGGIVGVGKTMPASSPISNLSRLSEPSASPNGDDNEEEDMFFNQEDGMGFALDEEDEE